MSSKNLHTVDDSKEAKKARSRRRTRALAKKLLSGVFKFPLCCRPSTLEDQEDYILEYGNHLPYAARKVPESVSQLVSYQRNVPECRSQHIPHALRKVPARSSNQLQRKVTPFPWQCFENKKKLPVVKMFTTFVSSALCKSQLLSFVPARF